MSIITRPYSLSNEELQRAINDTALHSQKTDYDRRVALTAHLKALCAEQERRARQPHYIIQTTNAPPAGLQWNAGERKDAPSAGGAHESKENQA